ncbi:MAG: DUF2344 domain-containing protein [Clostridia bacterium]|nr:DUF2344 domain-containing protein [Clostridia bacterium]
MRIIRIKYKKEDSVKYVSHLETIKVFQRAIRRSGLKPKYSQGFNPQMHLIFGLPLPVGVTSDAEYADIFFEEDYSASDIMKVLPCFIPDGFNMIDCGIRENDSNIMNDIEYADYEIKLESEVSKKDIVEQLSQLEVIEVIKVKQNKEKKLDIKPLIIKMSTDHDIIRLYCKAGNQTNLHPRLFISAINRYIDQSATEISIRRKEIYAVRNQKTYTPLEKNILE